MDNFKMPMRELQKRYTASDIALMAWDSRQRSYNMTQRYKRNGNAPHSDAPQQKTDTEDTHHVRYRGETGSTRFSSQIVETNTHYLMPKSLNNGVAIPKKFFNADGEIDLRQATGSEACSYLRAVGIDLPPVLRF